MATYYQGGASEIQAGDNNLQTLYLMNPNLITTTTTTPDYSDQTHQHHNHHHHHQQQQHIMLNPTVTPNTLTHGIIPQHHHPQLVGIPLAGPHHHSASGADLSRADLSRTSLQHHNHHLNQMASAINGLVGPRAHYASSGLWSPASDAGPAQSGPIQDFPGQGQGQGQGQARGGLSLSLSPGLQRARAEGDDGRMSVTLAGPGPGPGPMVGSKYLKAAQELLEEVVKVADNNNNVGGGDHNNNNNNNMESSKGKAVVEEGGGDDVAGGGDGGESSKKGGELSMAQRHELQMKKAKLLNMLDEVDQRYRQYNTQMQIIASSFEQAAGIGSAKSYTSLALKTISKQFRTLKDAISSQIKAANKSLGEENIVGVKLEGGGGVGSRLRLVDQQISQHRALQQLGMMQHSHNAWRPQRGLPERAVSVLRAWLFEHFLHPYPKDSDKHMLAKQTGLTRSQVSNWFINARVRLWKPMVEEMYVEEMKSHEQNNIVPTDDTTTTTTTNNGGQIGGSSSKNERNQDLSTTNKTTIITQQQHQQPQQQVDLGFDNNQQTTNDMISSLSTMSTTSPQGFTLIGSSSDMETLMARSQKKHRSNNNNNSDMNSPSSILSMDMEMKPIDHQQQHHQQQQPKYGQYSSSMTSIHGGTGYNNPYIMNNNHNNIGRLFSQNQLTTASYHGNAVALTLGLPHCDNNNNNNNNNGNNISLSENHHQQNFFPSNQGMDLGRRVEIGANEGDFCGSNIGGGGHETSHPSNNVVYESIDIQSRKRFAAQILHDFVA